MSGAFVLRRHPDAGIELRVARLGKRMRAVEVYRLACEHMDGFGVIGRQRIVRQVGMEVESRNVVEQPDLVQVLADRQWRDLA